MCKTNANKYEKEINNSGRLTPLTMDKIKQKTNDTLDQLIYIGHFT